MTKRKNISKLFDFVDIPVIVLVGAAAGCFIVGFIQATLGSILDAGEDEIFSIKAIVAGTLCVLISALILILTYLYWVAIPKRCGAVYPELNGFGTIIALMSMASSAMLSSELCSWVLYTY